MAEKESVKEDVKTKKQAFMEALKSRYPDLSMEDEDAVYGKLSDDFASFDRSRKAQKELADLMVSDPRSAAFLMVMRKGGNPVEFLIENYGDDFREALESEEGKQKFSEAFSKYMEKKTKDKALKEQANANLETMISDLETAQKEGKFSDEDATTAYTYLYGEGGLLERMIVNGVNKEDWMLLMKAAKYDQSMADAAKAAEIAREEGVIEGRNANIDMNKHKRTKTQRMPSDLGGSGGGGSNGKPKDETLEALDRITGRKSVWDD